MDEGGARLMNGRGCIMAEGGVVGRSSAGGSQDGGAGGAGLFAVVRTAWPRDPRLRLPRQAHRLGPARIRGLPGAQGGLGKRRGRGVWRGRGEETPPLIINTVGEGHGPDWGH